MRSLRLNIALFLTGLALLAPSVSRASCDAVALDSQAEASAKQLGTHAPELARRVLRLGLKAFFKARCQGEATRDVLAIIDFSLPSSVRRLWVFDVATASLLFQERVAHGRGSGDAVATRFSDQSESHASSLGLYVTGATYQGKHGYSLQIDGKEPGVNDRARDRAIVVHPAEYMTERFVQEHGRAGRSFGCPALDPRIASRVIDTIKQGSVLWAYYPDQKWLSRSPYLAE